MTLNIRPLTGSDVKAVQNLTLVLIPNTQTGDQTQFQQMLDHDDITVMGAELDTQIVAMATLYLLPNLSYQGRPFGVIENVITLPQHQGKGIMRAVMEQLHEIAWAKNAYKIMLMTGTDTGAKGFYEKLGYCADQKHALQIRRIPPRKPHGTVGGAT